MKNFQIPEADIVELQVEDVITTSIPETTETLPDGDTPIN